MARSAKPAPPRAKPAAAAPASAALAVLAPKGPDGVAEASARFVFDHPAVDTPASVASAWAPHRPARPTKSEGGKTFNLVSPFEPAGDQPSAIAELVKGVQAHDSDQVLLGVTGSGKTFTMAKIIEATQRPALILAHNKTLAAQLYSEFRSPIFPNNAVEYFVSYYDYYQPEAYVASHRHLHREGFELPERTDRPHAPLGDAGDPGARRRHRGRLACRASTASARSRPIRR